MTEERKPGEVLAGVGANTADLDALRGGRCRGCGASPDDCPIVGGYCSDVCEEQHKAGTGE